VSDSPQTVSLADVDAARAIHDTAGAGVVRHTPVVPAAALSGALGRQVVYKADNLQTTGSFKIRGALNKVASLGTTARAGVTAGSAGNHAQALAYAARHFQVPCEIFVPAGAPVVKIARCEALGAIVHEGGASLAEAVAASRARAVEAGLTFCHPYDDPLVIAGQGTLGLELVEDLPDLECVVIPLGGGGLAAGTAIAIKAHRPHVRVIAVQASVCAPYAGDPPPSGPIVTLADGIAVKYPGEITRPLVERFVDEIVTVDEDTIADAMVMLMDAVKLYVEGAGAVGAAALMSDPQLAARDGSTCVVVSGGNVDLGVVPGLIRRREHQAGRRLTVFARIDDRPGGMIRFLQLFAEAGANLIEVEHHREGLELHVRETGVRATFEVRSPAHAAAIVAAARAAGYPVETA